MIESQRENTGRFMTLLTGVRGLMKAWREMNDHMNIALDSPVLIN